MKRIILLLLVLSCFLFSYGEELSAEQQQLAWKFIYDNMLSKEYQPNTFKKDIIINLKGEITSADSVTVKELIKSFQRAIPHLKIELSEKPGNLKLGLNEGKNNRVTTNLQSNHSITSQEMYFPNNMTDKQKKQFIYFHLFKGLTFYNWPKVPIDGLSGCVFAENDFDSIIFSPFDLFILEKLYSPDFLIELSKNLSPELQDLAWKSIGNKFMAGRIKRPIIYHTDIAIKLEGAVSPIDSTCINELISNLRSIIPNRKISLTKEKANMVFTFSDTLRGLSTANFERNMIEFTGCEVSFPKNKSKEERKKVLYNYLFKSLVRYQESLTEKAEIEGCVFGIETPDKIIYHPVDAFILNKLYSDDVAEQLKNNWIKKWSAKSYYSFMYFIQLRTAGIIIGILLAIFLFSVLIKRGIFRFHNWNLNRFIIQIFWIIGICDIYQISNLVIRHLSFQFFIYEGDFFRSFVFINLTLFIVPLIFFLTERKLNTLNVAPKNKLLFLIANSFVISFSITLVYLIVYLRNDFDYKVTISIGVSFVFATFRFLLFTFTELKKNELKEKNNELALLKEKSKQAELQSLRAKINPHFLYNALNSIASLATTDARKTEQMALALSDFFKYAINREQKQMNTLSEELNAIRTYLEIEKVRFGDRLSFEIDCPAELLDIQIPQLLIQPLVENAIKHGLSQITENGLIGILVCKEESLLRIRVYDNGPAFPEGPLTGFGIQNTQERIALLYGAKATINWQNGAEKFVEISIPLGQTNISV